MMYSNQPYQKVDDSTYRWGIAAKATAFGLAQGALQEGIATVVGTGKVFGRQIFNPDNKVSRWVSNEMLYQKQTFGDHALVRGLNEKGMVRRALRHIPDHGLKTPVGRVMNYGGAVLFGLLTGFHNEG